MTPNAQQDALAVVILFASSVRTRKITRTGIDALKNMALILDFAFIIVPMMIALVTVSLNIKLKFKIARVRFEFDRWSVALS